MPTMRRYLSAPAVSQFAITIFDAALAALSAAAVMQWRYDFQNRTMLMPIDDIAAAVFAGVTILVWIFLRVYRGIWRFTALDDIKQLLGAAVLVTLVSSIILFIFFNQRGSVPRSIPFLIGPLFFGLLTLSRIIALIVLNGDLRAIFRGQAREKPPAILIGSAASLSDYLRDFTRRSMGHDYLVTGLVATDQGLRGRSIRGVPVLGALDGLDDIYARFRERHDGALTLIATDKQPGKIGSYELVKRASDLGAPLVRVSSSHGEGLTKFEAADLIGRLERDLDLTPVRQFIRNKRVLITGAGGTIGSELTRQITALSPAKIILLDASEFNLYEIDKELKGESGASSWQTWSVHLGSICDRSFLTEVFKEHRPEVVLHAAAFKHVPLSELNPIETLQTNVRGTKYVLDLCREYGAESFTLISTDKAVAPSNMMGASKRIAEMLTLTDGQVSERRGTGKSALSACAVRFGNVLASTGSVVPLFEEQIARGGPVTVTDPNVNRYFMTTREAAALVLQAAALNQSQKNNTPSVYVLEMGEPVNIAHLARQLIRLRGYVPDRDIKILFTGLRPGEKVSERLTGQAEHLENTYVAGVQRFTGIVIDAANVRRKIDTLLTALDGRDRSRIKKALAALLPDYIPNGSLSPSPDGRSQNAEHP